MKRCRTCSIWAHKPEISADSTLTIFLSPRADFQFHVPMFGALYLANLAEPGQAPIGKVVVLPWISNFVNYALR